MPRWLVAVAVVAVSAGILFIRSWRVDYPYSIDFRVYHIAAGKIAAGQSSELYGPDRVQTSEGEISLPANEFKNIPAIALLFLPLASLSYLEAKRLFWIVSLACLLAAALITARRLSLLNGRTDPLSICLVVALFLVATPGHIALRHGQLTPLATLGFALFASSALAGRQRLAGSALAATTLLKLPPLALVGRDLIRGPARRLAWWSLVTAAAVIASLALFGPALHGSFLAHLASQFGHGISGHNNQSLDGILMRALARGDLQDWTPLTEPAAVQAAKWTAGAILLGLLLVALSRSGGILRRHSTNGPALALEIMIFLSLGLLLSPVAWDHYFLILVAGLPYTLWAVGRCPAPSSRWLRAACLGSGALLVLPTPSGLISRAGPAPPAVQLVIAHYAIGALALFLLALLARIQLGSGPEAAGEAGEGRIEPSQ
jgi:hypothetical protein